MSVGRVLQGVSCAQGGSVCRKAGCARARSIASARPPRNGERGAGAAAAQPRERWSSADMIDLDSPQPPGSVRSAARARPAADGSPASRRRRRHTLEDSSDDERAGAAPAGRGRARGEPETAPRWGAGARLRRRTMAALRPWRWTPLRGPRRGTGWRRRRRRRRTVRRQQRRAVMGLDPATRRGPHSRQGWPSSRLRRRRARRCTRACRAAASPRSHPGWSSAGRTARRRPSLRSRWPWATTPAAASATRLSARRCCSAPSVRVQTYTLAANRVAYYGGKRRARAVYMDSMNLVQRPFHARPPSSEELQAVRGTRHLLAARCVLLTAARAACEAAL